VGNSIQWKTGGFDGEPDVWKMLYGELERRGIGSKEKKGSILGSRQAA